MKYDPKRHKFTGEVRIPRSGEWFWNGGRFRDDEVLLAFGSALWEYPIITLIGDGDGEASAALLGRQRDLGD